MKKKFQKFVWLTIFKTHLLKVYKKIMHFFGKHWKDVFKFPKIVSVKKVQYIKIMNTFVLKTNSEKITCKTDSKN